MVGGAGNAGVAARPKAGLSTRPRVALGGSFPSRPGLARAVRQSGVGEQRWVEASVLAQMKRDTGTRRVAPLLVHEKGHGCHHDPPVQLNRS